MSRQQDRIDAMKAALLIRGTSEYDDLIAEDLSIERRERELETLFGVLREVLQEDNHPIIVTAAVFPERVNTYSITAALNTKLLKAGLSQGAINELVQPRDPSTGALTATSPLYSAWNNDRGINNATGVSDKVLALDTLLQGLGVTDQESRKKLIALARLPDAYSIDAAGTANIESFSKEWIDKVIGQNPNAQTIEVALKNFWIDKFTNPALAGGVALKPDPFAGFKTFLEIVEQDQQLTSSNPTFNPNPLGKFFPQFSSQYSTSLDPSSQRGKILSEVYYDSAALKQRMQLEAPLRHLGYLKAKTPDKFFHPAFQDVEVTKSATGVLSLKFEFDNEEQARAFYEEMSVAKDKDDSLVFEENTRPVIRGANGKFAVSLDSNNHYDSLSLRRALRDGNLTRKFKDELSERKDATTKKILSYPGVPVAAAAVVAGEIVGVGYAATARLPGSEILAAASKSLFKLTSQIARNVGATSLANACDNRYNEIGRNEKKSYTGDMFAALGRKLGITKFKDAKKVSAVDVFWGIVSIPKAATSAILTPISGAIGIASKFAGVIPHFLSDTANLLADKAGKYAKQSWKKGGLIGTVQAGVAGLGFLAGKVCASPFKVVGVVTDAIADAAFEIPKHFSEKSESIIRDVERGFNKARFKDRGLNNEYSPAVAVGKSIPTANSPQSDLIGRARDLLKIKKGLAFATFPDAQEAGLPEGAKLAKIAKVRIGENKYEVWGSPDGHDILIIDKNPDHQSKLYYLNDLPDKFKIGREAAKFRDEFSRQLEDEIKNPAKSLGSKKAAEATRYITLEDFHREQENAVNGTKSKTQVAGDLLIKALGSQALPAGKEVEANGYKAGIDQNGKLSSFRDKYNRDVDTSSDKFFNFLSDVAKKPAMQVNNAVAFPVAGQQQSATLRGIMPV
jgi:hypothetical protein